MHSNSQNNALTNCNPTTSNAKAWHVSAADYE